MDYVLGRRVELMAIRDAERHEYMWAPWQGRSKDDLRTLCDRIGAADPFA